MGLELWRTPSRSGSSRASIAAGTASAHHAPGWRPWPLGAFVYGKVVENDDVAGLQRRSELGFDVAVEGVAIHRARKHPGRGQPSWRRAAMKVCVPRRPNGALGSSRCPRTARPRRRVMRVVIEVSSRNTTRLSRWHSHGSSQRNQRRRRLATSARSISVAASDFFICPARPAQKPRQRARMRPDAMDLLQPPRQFRQGDVGLLLHPARSRRLKRPELAAARSPPATARLGRTRRLHTRQQFDRAARTDAEPPRRPPSRRSACHRRHNARPQIHRIALRHRHLRSR